MLDLFFELGLWQNQKLGTGSTLQRSGDITVTQEYFLEPYWASIDFHCPSQCSMPWRLNYFWFRKRWTHNILFESTVAVERLLHGDLVEDGSGPNQWYSCPSFTMHTANPEIFGVCSDIPWTGHNLYLTRTEMGDRLRRLTGLSVNKFE